MTSSAPTDQPTGHSREPAGSSRPPAGRSGRGGLGGILLAWLIGPAIILGWLGFMALAYVLFEPGETVMVVGPQARNFQAIAEADAQVLSSGEGFLVARSDRPGYVRRLYSGGAWLVLPATDMMCGHPGIVRKIATGK